MFSCSATSQRLALTGTTLTANSLLCSLYYSLTAAHSPLPTHHCLVSAVAATFRLLLVVFIVHDAAFGIGDASSKLVGIMGLG